MTHKIYLYRLLLIIGKDDDYYCDDYDFWGGMGVHTGEGWHLLLVVVVAVDDTRTHSVFVASRMQWTK